MDRQTPDIFAESGAFMMRAVQWEFLEVLDG